MTAFITTISLLSYREGSWVMSRTSLAGSGVVDNFKVILLLHVWVVLDLAQPVLDGAGGLGHGCAHRLRGWGLKQLNLVSWGGELQYGSLEPVFHTWRQLWHGHTNLAGVKRTDCLSQGQNSSAGRAIVRQAQFPGAMNFSPCQFWVQTLLWWLYSPCVQ